MCVIAVVSAENQRLTPEQINKMWDANDFGAGVVWVDEAAKKTKWEKGLTLEQVLLTVPTLPLPYAVHFRNPSVGTSLSQLSCHPFGIDDEANTDLSGETEGAVLMHNGFWGQWKEKLLDFSARSGVPLPSGPWSDSRGLAWCASVLGIGAIELIGEKVLIFSPTIMENYGNGWVQMPNGLLVSNTNWEVTVHRPTHGHGGHYHTTPPASMAGSKGGEQASNHGNKGNTGAAGGASQVPCFPYSHRLEPVQPPGTVRPLPGGESGEKALQETPASLRQPAKDGTPASGDRTPGYIQGLVNNTLCVECKKKPGHIIDKATRMRRCQPCYEDWQRRQRKVSGTLCDFCSKVPTTAITVEGIQYICTGCWRELNKPAIVREQDLLKRDLDDILSKRVAPVSGSLSE